MFSILIDVHKNILSAQCYIKYESKETTISKMEIVGSKNAIFMSLFSESNLLQKIKLSIPNDFFILSSLSLGESNDAKAEIESDSFKIIQETSYRKSLENETFKIDKCSTEDKIDSLAKRMDCKVNILDIDNPVVNAIKISFRLQISSDKVVPETETNSLLPFTLYRYVKSEVVSNELYEVVCTNCSNLLSTVPVSFQDVKECNSFSDLSENWFCHKKVKPNTDFNDKTLYVSDGQMYLHSSIFEKFQLDIYCNEFKCKNCNVTLTSGTIPESNGKYFKCFFADGILLKNIVSSMYDCRTYCYKIAGLFLLSLIDQKTFSICRLFLQSKVEENEDRCLLLLIFCSEAMQFKFSSDTDNLPEEVNFSTQGIYKVRYFIGTLSSPLVARWSKDFGVAFYKIGSGLMKATENLLKLNSGLISEEQSDNECFLNSFIPSSIAPFTDFAL